MTETRPLKTAKEAARANLDPETIWEKAVKAKKMTRAQLMKVHNENAREGFNWIAAPELKEKFNLTSHVLELLGVHYDLPKIVFDAKKPAIYSAPAFEYIMSNATELQNSDSVNPVKHQLATLHEEALAETKAKLVHDLEAKIQNTQS